MNIQDLAGFIGISRRTLFECRSADSAATGKTWAKLEAAEVRAGLCEKKPGDVVRTREVKEIPAGADEKSPVLTEDPSSYGTVRMRMAAMEAELAATRDAMRRMGDTITSLQRLLDSRWNGFLTADGADGTDDGDSSSVKSV